MDKWLPTIDLFNAYGWFALILVLERLFPIRPTPFFNKGWVFDLIHTYEPYVRALVIGSAAAWAVPYALELPGAGLLAGKGFWASILALMLVSEFTFYWLHRWMHSSPWLWEFHQVHHSSTTYYSFMTSRFHIVDMLIFNLPYVCIAAWMGAEQNALIAYAVFQGFVDRYGHSNVNGPRFHNWVGYFFGSPHFHAWHHSVQPEAHGKNFSRDFVFMDRIFGTAYYPVNVTPMEFGDPNFSNNYFVQQALPFWRVAKGLAGRRQPAVAPQATASRESVREPVAEAALEEVPKT